jgi:glycerophosphoryl diester phosphodiesterase
MAAMEEGADAPRRPLVVAHRGATDTAAEHTLGAYVLALDQGADGLECDVRLTADGHLVCVHDRRIDRTTNARGVVSTMTLAELDELDAGSWKHPWADLDDEAVEIDQEYNRVLTLRRLLEVVRDYDRPVRLAVETKHPTRYAGLVERRLVELLEEFGWTGRDSPVTVMSFSALALNRVARLAPDVEIALLVEGATPWTVIHGMLRPGWIVGPGVETLRERPRLRRRLVEGGYRVHVWIVNTAEQLALCQELGVEAVITDRPGHIRRLLGDTPPRG